MPRLATASRDGQGRHEGGGTPRASVEEVAGGLLERAAQHPSGQAAMRAELDRYFAEVHRPAEPSPQDRFLTEMREALPGRYARQAERIYRRCAESSQYAPAKVLGMSAPSTTAVEIDTALLQRLRERRPEKSDRELVESIARIDLGREASARARERFAGVSSEEIEREAVKAAREVRRERAAARRATGAGAL